MNPRRYKVAAAWVALVCGTGFGQIPSLNGAEKETTPAEVRVKGLGLWKNREERVSLVRLLGTERGATMDANAIEDATFLLLSGLTEKGFLRPEIEVTAYPVEGGDPVRFTLDYSLSTLIPRPLEAKRVEFLVKEQVRFTFDVVAFKGLTLIEEPDAVRFFKPADTLWQSAASRAYSPARLRRAADNLQDQLRLLGYADATVVATVQDQNFETGQVSVSVDVKEGLRSMVRKLDVEGLESTGAKFVSKDWVGRPWTPLWQQDLAEALRRQCVTRGYPDVRIVFQRRPLAVDSEEQPIAVEATVHPGDQVQVGQVRFVGNEHTQEKVLRRRVPFSTGDELDILQVERARARLARLGVFSTVRTDFTPSTGEVRDVTFSVEELPRWETNLLFGYGSYERVRGGIEWRQSNLFGRAHQSRLLLVQSLKSTRADYLYSVPELFGESLDGAVRVFGLRREEPSFVREEYGTNVSLRRRLGRRLEGRVGYTYQALRNQDNELTTREIDDRLVKVGSVEVGLTSDRRDNPLRPRRGLRWFGQIEAASKTLGGEVDFQVYEVGVSYHTSWGNSRWIHAGLSHGAITTFGADNDRDLPVNKRFFPGGETSMRGYQRGEASPRGADGRFIGAKSQVVFNLELEQGLTGNWSGVLFFDALGTAVELSDYPLNEELYAVGIGVRYQTLVGPVRLEYGRNLNPRVGDPGGTLHFSIGFPF